MLSIVIHTDKWIITREKNPVNGKEYYGISCKYMFDNLGLPEHKDIKPSFAVNFAFLIDDAYKRFSDSGLTWNDELKKIWLSIPEKWINKY